VRASLFQLFRKGLNGVGVVEGAAGTSQSLQRSVLCAGLR